jgi:sarcosine oxidase
MERIETDVVVIGVGAMGSMTLWQLARRGVDAVGIEQFEPGHDRGSSHGETRIYRTAYLEGPGYVPLAQRALVLWRELQAESGAALLIENGALMIGTRGGSVINGTMRSIEAHNLPHELLQPEEVAARYPAHRLAPDDVAIHEEDAGLVRPERAIVAAVGCAMRQGVRLRRNLHVDRIDITPDGVTVVAGDVECRARHAVISAGTWLGKLMPELRLPLRVTRQVLGWFPIERPEQFAPDHFPVFLRDIGDHSGREDIVATDSTFYGFPSLDRRTIKIAIHREGPAADPDALDRSATPDELADIGHYVELFLRDVSGTPIDSRVCMYTNTPDHDFLVGSPAGMPNVTILGGFSGHGFKFASVMGEIGADLSTVGRTDHPIGFLSLDRFGA